MTCFPRLPRLCGVLSIAGTALAQPIDFNTQIRPIFNQNCVACHGGVKSASDISFFFCDVTTRGGEKSRKRVIVSCQPDESEVIVSRTATDQANRLPPD